MSSYHRLFSRSFLKRAALLKVSSSCSYISHQKKRHFALGLDHSDLKMLGDIHWSSQQNLPITRPATVSVYRRQPPFPAWCTSEIPADGVTEAHRAKLLPRLFQHKHISLHFLSHPDYSFSHAHPSSDSLHLTPARDWAPHCLPGSVVWISLDCPDWKP